MGHGPAKRMAGGRFHLTTFAAATHEARLARKPSIIRDIVTVASTDSVVSPERLKRATNSTNSRAYCP